MSRVCPIKTTLPLKLAVERLSLPFSLWHIGARSWQIRAGWNSRSLSCLLTGKWVGTRSYLYFPKQPAETHECFCWRTADECQLANTKEDELSRNLPTRSLPLMSITNVFQVISGFDAAQKQKNKLTNFKSCLLGRAVVVHLAHKRAHLHRVLVLMVQAVSLKRDRTISLSKTLSCSYVEESYTMWLMSAVLKSCSRTMQHW